MSETEYNLMKEEAENSRKTGGRYQALKEQVAKCHQIIDKLSKENKLMRRALKEKDIDINKEKCKLNREKR